MLIAVWSEEEMIEKLFLNQKVIRKKGNFFNSHLCQIYLIAKLFAFVGHSQGQ
jgi:hypothetical protein